MGDKDIVFMLLLVGIGVLIGLAISTKPDKHTIKKEPIKSIWQHKIDECEKEERKIKAQIKGIDDKYKRNITKEDYKNHKPNTEGVVLHNSRWFYRV